MLELIKYEISDENQVCQEVTTSGVIFSTYEEMDQFRDEIERSSNHKIWLTYRHTPNIKMEQNE